MFKQYHYLQHHNGAAMPELNNLPLIPYYLYIAGKQGVLNEHKDALDRATDTTVILDNLEMDLINLTHQQVDRLSKQAFALEQIVFGTVRPEVSLYFDSMRRFINRRDKGKLDPEKQVLVRA